MYTKVLYNKPIFEDFESDAFDVEDDKNNEICGWDSLTGWLLDDEGSSSSAEYDLIKDRETNSVSHVVRLYSGGDYPTPSGAWSTTFDVSAEDDRNSTLILEFDYYVQMDQRFDDETEGSIKVHVDEAAVGFDKKGNPIYGWDKYITVATFDKHSFEVGEWQTAHVELGTYAQGTHEIKIGGRLCSQPEDCKKKFELQFNNMRIYSLPGAQEDVTRLGTHPDFCKLY
ncbi:expressed unknown protein [Seminavis robusta]|uniref:Uncharacterized protein n=1 Tax=Seminavis robusta TaxID=568900 RepID=A0A9N8EFY7_9STRA|nr:expressed unknown protein [Seminavis robusta]|eukprot:Sro1037_g234170.1 n/a (227) ;mRNA; r:22900-23580